MRKIALARRVAEDSTIAWPAPAKAGGEATATTLASVLRKSYPIVRYSENIVEQIDTQLANQTRHSISEQLEQCRIQCLVGQFAGFQNRLDKLAKLELSPECALRLEVLRLYPGATQPATPPSQLLQRALSLLELAKTLASPLAQAWIWEVMQVIQIQLQLHYAALHSTAMATELFEECGRTQDALSMRISRCLVMIHCEMYKEVLIMSRDILFERATLQPIALCNVLRSAASANFFLGIDAQEEQAIAYWRSSLALHEECLNIAKANAISRFILIAHTNIAILCASLGQREATTANLIAVEGMQNEAQLINVSWPYWLRFCEALLLCQGHEFQQGWEALLKLAKELENAELITAPVLDVTLRKLVSLGRQHQFHEIALDASQMLVKLSNRRRHALSKTLGETIDDVMSVPNLKQRNQELSQQGDFLEESLARRNQELSQALAELQAEASVRRAAEMALKEAHDQLEEQVLQRTAELQNTLRVVMRQEKQLALGRLVVGIAHELNTPLGNATMAASTMAHMCENLQNDIHGASLSRSKLQATVHSLIEGNELLDRSIKTAAGLIQRFRSLAIEQNDEELVDFDLSLRCKLITENWQQGFASDGVEFKQEIQGHIVCHGYPNALVQVIEHVFENALKHAFTGVARKRTQLIAMLDQTDVVIRIEDNGVGIEQEIIDRVFEPFFSKHLGSSGVGLGLSIVHSVVTELMHGTVKISTVQPHGTAVELRFPLEQNC